MRPGFCRTLRYGRMANRTTELSDVQMEWGAVRRIHRVDSYYVIPTLRDRCPELPKDELRERPHAIYTLSPR